MKTNMEGKFLPTNVYAYNYSKYVEVAQLNTLSAPHIPSLPWILKALSAAVDIFVNEGLSKATIDQKLADITSGNPEDFIKSIVNDDEVENYTWATQFKQHEDLYSTYQPVSLKVSIYFLCCLFCLFV